MTVAVGRHHGGVLKGSVLGGKGGRGRVSASPLSPSVEVVRWTVRQQLHNVHTSFVLVVNCEWALTPASPHSASALMQRTRFIYWEKTTLTIKQTLMSKSKSHVIAIVRSSVSILDLAEGISYKLLTRKFSQHSVTTQHTVSQATKHQQTKQPEWVRCRLALCDLTKQSHSMWLFHSMGSLT